ncbi:MAG: metallophosphoesterase family protein [Candidatus Hydrogenedentes bacterium]|nr:metallophosphoesterase family protein [Candidatus Hydrogenedentota bacterium]
MLIAVIGGAQGDVHALDAALSRVDSLGIHTVLCTGNLAAGGDDGNAVIDRLRERGVTCVQGEMDRLVVRALRKADSMRKRLDEIVFDAVMRGHESLTNTNIEFLRALPQRRDLTFEGKALCLCHGTVSSQSNTLTAEDSIDRFRRQREAANAEIVVCGSDDEAFVKVVDETLFVNSGALKADANAISLVVVNSDDEPCSAVIERAEFTSP